MEDNQPEPLLNSLLNGVWHAFVVSILSYVLQQTVSYLLDTLGQPHHVSCHLVSQEHLVMPKRTLVVCYSSH